MACKVRQCNWRCLECIGGAYECSGCFRDRHKFLPFHRVENWTGTHFKQAWLCQVGVEIHLGHHGNPCPSRSDGNHQPDPGADGCGADGGGAPGTSQGAGNGAAQDAGDRAAQDAGDGAAQGAGGGGAPEDAQASGAAEGIDRGEAPDPPVSPNPDEDTEEYIDVSGDEEEDPMEDVIGGHGLPHLTGEDVCVVVDKSGVHRLRVRPCWCGAGGPLDLQFMDMRLFPASLKKIQTAFTFGVLDDFRMDNLECKTAGLRYFNKLKRLTSNAFPHSVPVGP